jgi:hypothetical protein
LRGFRTAWPPILEDAASREARWLAAEEKKKDEEKKRAHKKILARDALEKRHRVRAREGIPLEASPSMGDDDSDGKGMEVRMGFSPKAGL